MTTYSLANLKGQYITIDSYYHNAYDIGILWLNTTLNFEPVLNFKYGSEYLSYTDHLNRTITVSSGSVIILGEEIKKLLESKSYGFNSLNSEVNRIYFDWVAKHSNNYANPNVKIVEIKNEEKPILRPANEVREVQNKLYRADDILDKIADSIDKHIKTSADNCITFTDEALKIGHVIRKVIETLEDRGYKITIRDTRNGLIKINW